MPTYETDFDLWADPWLTAVRTNGGVVTLSLREVLSQAPLLAGLTDPSPLALFTTHRLLAAILADALPLTTLDEWHEVWQAGAFDRDVLDQAEAACAGRMRLFDEQRPFYQTSDIPLYYKRKAKTVGYLHFDLSTGTNVTHFHHAGDDDHALCGPCCARGLLTYTAFAIAGGAGIKAGLPGVPPTFLLPTGRTLFHTLLLNHLLPEWRGTTVDPDQDPGAPWAQPAPVVVPKSQARTSVGWIESLTWRPRRVRLVNPTDGHCSRCGSKGAVVRQMIFEQGYGLDSEVMWIDPWAAYKPKAKDEAEVIPVRPRDGVQTWRDFDQLFLTSGKGDSLRRPFVLRQLDSLIDQGYLDQTSATYLDFEAISMRTDMKAKVFEWRHDAFVFAPQVTANEAANELLRGLLQQAEQGWWALRLALARLVPQGRDSDGAKRLTGQLCNLAGARYWRSLEPEFHRCLADARLLASDADRVDLHTDWLKLVRATARDAFRDAAESASADGLALRRAALAEVVLFKALPKLPKEDKHERQPIAS